MDQQRAKGKPRGAAALVHQKMARLDVLANTAIRRLEKILDEKSQATNAEVIQTAKIILEYAWGKPKQQVQVDAKVEINHKAHIEALRLLVPDALGPVIDANPLKQLDYSPDGTIHNHLDAANQGQIGNSLNPTNLVEIGLVGAGLAGEAGQDGPPPAAGTPGGGPSTGQGGALDTEK